MTHSSLTRSGAIARTFDGNPFFTFTIVNGATPGFHDNVISGLSGLDPVASGLGHGGAWLIDPATGLTGSFS